MRFFYKVTLQWRTWLLVKGGAKFLGKDSSKMIKFMLIMHFIYIYIHLVYAPQYLTRGNIETVREYLETRETRSDKSISSNSMCDLASIILKNNYFENEELKYHRKRGFANGTKFATPYSNLFMAGLEKRIFQNSEFKCGYDSLMTFFVYGPKVL